LNVSAIEFSFKFFKGQHSFCFVCLKNYESQKCPVCREESKINFTQLPKNRYILSYLERLKAKEKTKSVSLLPTQNNQKKRNFLPDFFKHLDSDRDDKISLSDLVNGGVVKTNSGLFFKANNQILFNKFDKDNDGLIDYDEFTHFYAELNEDYLNELLKK
jgi:Ca2+-binding EF-hand superfamily protein